MPGAPILKRGPASIAAEGVGVWAWLRLGVFVSTDGLKRMGGVLAEGCFGVLVLWCWFAFVCSRL